MQDPAYVSVNFNRPTPNTQQSHFNYIRIPVQTQKPSIQMSSNLTHDRIIPTLSQIILTVALALRRAAYRVVLRTATSQHSQEAAHGKDGPSMAMENALI